MMHLRLRKTQLLMLPARFNSASCSHLHPPTLVQLSLERIDEELKKASGAARRVMPQHISHAHFCRLDPPSAGESEFNSLRRKQPKLFIAREPTRCRYKSALQELSEKVAAQVCKCRADRCCRTISQRLMPLPCALMPSPGQGNQSSAEELRS
jgi:hypothetical protein